LVQEVVNWRLKGVHVQHNLHEFRVGVLQLFHIYWSLEVFVGQALVKEVKDASEALFETLNSIEAYLFYMNF